MPRLLKTIEQYIVEDRKQDTLFINFSTTYNKKRLHLDDHYDDLDWLDKKNVNYKKRDEFVHYINGAFPHINIMDVFDNVPLVYELWPFLGTIAIDVNADSEEAKKIIEMYEDSHGNPLALDGDRSEFRVSIR